MSDEQPQTPQSECDPPPPYDELTLLRQDVEESQRLCRFVKEKLHELEQVVRLQKTTKEVIKEVHQVNLNVKPREEDPDIGLKLNTFIRRLNQLEYRQKDQESIEDMFDKLKFMTNDYESSKHWFEKSFQSAVTKVINTLADRYDIFVEKWALIEALKTCPEFQKVVEQLAEKKLKELLDSEVFEESVEETIKTVLSRSRFYPLCNPKQLYKLVELTPEEVEALEESSEEEEEGEEEPEDEETEENQQKRLKLLNFIKNQAFSFGSSVTNLLIERPICKV